MKRVASDAPPEVRGDAKVRVEGVSKYMLQHGQPFAVLQEVNLYAQAGEFVSLIGPSGCGKSTLLNIIAGLEQPSSGTLYLNGRRAEQRLGTVGYMQQKDLLLPWRNVLDNVILGLELRGMSRRLARARALALMEQFGLKGFETAYPYTLSGGMRQRAAFLRTILPEQEVFLLDEPFGALDSITRRKLQRLFQRIASDLDLTAILVTHDVDEARLLGDRVAVLRDGKLLQVGTPAELGRRPANDYVRALLTNEDVPEAAGS